MTSNSSPTEACRSLKHLHSLGGVGIVESESDRVSDFRNENFALYRLRVRCKFEFNAEMAVVFARTFCGDFYVILQLVYREFAYLHVFYRYALLNCNRFNMLQNSLLTHFSCTMLARLSGSHTLIT